MGLCLQVTGSFMSDHIFYPKHGLVQWFHGLISVQPREPLHVFPVRGVVRSCHQGVCKDVKKSFEANLPLMCSFDPCVLRFKMSDQFYIFFQNLPIFSYASFFKRFNSIVLPFIWGHKLHRVTKAHLHKPLQKGGLGLFQQEASAVKKKIYVCFLHFCFSVLPWWTSQFNKTLP